MFENSTRCFAFRLESVVLITADHPDCQHKHCADRDADQRNSTVKWANHAAPFNRDNLRANHLLYRGKHRMIQRH